MKRTIILILTLCLTWTVSALALSDQVTEISDADGLAAIASDPGGAYRLVCDIDLSGRDWVPFDFSGSLDGNGFAVLNLSVTEPGPVKGTSVDGNRLRYETGFAGLFAHMEGAEVRDLVLKGVSVMLEQDEPCFAGGLAGSGHDVIVDNVDVSGRIWLHQSAKMGGVAGIVGYGNGDFTGCIAEVELVFVDRNTKTDCEQFAGGVMACGYPNVTDCRITANLWASVHGYCHNGGLVGMHHVDTKDRIKGTISGNTVSCTLDFFEDVGSRRAYGSALVGEELNRDLTIGENTVDTFVRRESKDYSVDLYPCVHTLAVQEKTVGPTCEEYGYTEHVCTVCNYTYRNQYTLKSHQAGEWETVREPEVSTDGLRCRYCVICGAIMEQEVLPAHIPGEWVIEKQATYEEAGLRVQRCTDCGVILAEETIAPHTAGEWQIVAEPTYDAPGEQIRVCQDCGEVTEREEIPRLTRIQKIQLPETVTVVYRETVSIASMIIPEDTEEKELMWISSDESIVSVDEEGNLTGNNPGDAVVTCETADHRVSSEVVVSVRYSAYQWFLMTVCFGWLWY